MKKIIATLLFFTFSFFANAQTGYEIKINLKNSKDTIAFLTYYQFDKTYLKDTCKVIKNGKIVFKGKGKLDRGIYSLVSQQKTIVFDFFVDENTQQLELSSDEPTEFMKDLVATNSKTETDFFDYIRYITAQRKQMNQFFEESKSKSKADSTALINTKRKKIEDEIQDFESNFVTKHNNSYIADVVQLKMEKTLKKVPLASNGRPDSLKVYHYYKKHYWDHVDFKKDETMRNPFFTNKLKTYFDAIVYKHPDSVSVEIDRILSQTEPNSLLYKLMLGHFIYAYETTKIGGFDKVFVYISDRYFKTGKAAGIYEDESVVQKIIDRADKLKPLLVGAVAPELYMISANDSDKITKMGFNLAKTSDEVTALYYKNIDAINATFQKLSDVKADYLILVFWDVDCGHCQKEIPILLEQYHKLQKEKKDVKVFSVYIENEIEKYHKYIDEKKLDWINVYDGVHYNNVAQKYDVYSTPVIYILDKNKVIKAKRINAEQVGEVIKFIELENKK